MCKNKNNTCLKPTPKASVYNKYLYEENAIEKSHITTFPPPAPSQGESISNNLCMWVCVPVQLFSALYTRTFT